VTARNLKAATEDEVTAAPTCPESAAATYSLNPPHRPDCPGKNDGDDETTMTKRTDKTAAIRTATVADRSWSKKQPNEDTGSTQWVGGFIWYGYFQFDGRSLGRFDTGDAVARAIPSSPSSVHRPVRS
jgi:hypothetical protein